MRYFEIIGGLVVHPREYARLLCFERRSLIESIFTVLFFNAMYYLILSSSLFTLTTPLIKVTNSMIHIPIVSGLLGLATGFIVLIGVLFGVVIWLIWSLLSHLFAKLLGGTGDFESVLSLFGYNNFIIFLMIIPLLLTPISHFIAFLAGLVMTIATFIWMLYLNTIAVCEVHGISGFRGFISVFIPIPLTIVILGVCIMLTFICTSGITSTPCI